MGERLFTSQAVEKSAQEMPDLLEAIFEGSFRPEDADLLVPPPIRELKLPQEWYPETEAEQILGRKTRCLRKIRRIHGCEKIAGSWQIPASEIENYFNLKTAAEAAIIWEVGENLVLRALRSRDVQQAWSASKAGIFWQIPLATINRINALEKRTLLLTQAKEWSISHLGITGRIFYKLIRKPCRYFDPDEISALFGEKTDLSYPTLRCLWRDQNRYRGIDILDFAKFVKLIKGELRIRNEWVTSRQLASLTGFTENTIQELFRTGRIQARWIKIRGRKTLRYSPQEATRIVDRSICCPPPSRKRELRDAFNKRVRSIQIDESVLTLPISSYKNLTKKQEIQLIILVKQGNKKAFDRFFALYASLARKITYRRASDYQDFSIAEILAFAFRGLYAAAIYRYDFRKDFAKYAGGAIMHEIQRCVSQERPKYKLLAGSEDSIPSGQLDINELVETRLLTQQVNSQIPLLLPAQRMLILLMYRKGETITQAAQEMGISPEEAEIIHESAISFLRKSLNEN